MDGLEKADVFTDDNNQSGSSSSIELSGDSDNDHSIASDPSDDSDGDSDEKSRDGNNSHRGDEVDVQSDRAEVSGDEETREQSTERDSGKVSADADVKVQTHTVKREGIALRPNGVGSSGERKRPLKKSRAIATDATTQTTQKHSRSKPANKNKIKEEQAVAHSDDLIGNGADDDGNRQSGGESSSDEDAPLIAKIRVKGKRVGASTGDGKRSERADSAEPVGSQVETHKALTLLDAAEMVLQDAGPEGLHIKVIQTRCTERELIDPSKKKSLDALIYREAQRGSDRFNKVDGQPGFFALASKEDKALMVQRKAQRAEKVRLERHRKRASNERKLRYLKKTVRMMLFINTAMHEEMKALEASARKISRSKRQLVQRLKKTGEPIPSFIHETSASEDVDDEEVRRDNSGAQIAPLPWKHMSAQPPGHAQAQTHGLAPPPNKRSRPTSLLHVDVQVDAQGVPVEPFKVGPITVVSLGKIEWRREGYHSDRYIWPIGFTSERQGNSYLNLEERVLYTCKIIDGGDAPLFEVRAADDPDNPIIAPSSTSASVILMHKIKKARTGEINSKVTTSGPYFFGLSRPYVRKAILMMKDSEKLVNFNPHALDDSQKYGRRPGSERRNEQNSEPMRKRRRRAPTAAKTNGTTSTTQSQPHTHTQPQQQYAPRNTAASVGVTGSTAADGKRTDTRDGGVVHTNAVHVRKPSVPKLTLAQKLSKRRPTNKRTSGFT